MSTEDHIAQIQIRAEWHGYARSSREDAIRWASRDPESRRVVHIDHPDLVIYPIAARTPEAIILEAVAHLDVGHPDNTHEPTMDEALAVIAGGLDPQSTKRVLLEVVRLTQLSMAAAEAPASHAA